MEHQDAQVSNVTVVLKPDFAEAKLSQTLDVLKGIGLTVDEVDEGNGVVTGTIDAGKLAVLKQTSCIDYVRVEFTYVADYPPGDPRNQDASADADEDSKD